MSNEDKQVFHNAKCSSIGKYIIFNDDKELFDNAKASSSKDIKSNEENELLSFYNTCCSGQVVTEMVVNARKYIDSADYLSRKMIYSSKSWKNKKLRRLRINQVIVKILKINVKQHVHDF